MPEAQAPLSRRRTQTRERLLSAARAMFAARGIYGASVEDICEAAGFTRGAFYSNFTSKDDLFFALLELEKDARLRRIEQSFAQELPVDADPVNELVQRVLASQPMDRQWYLAHTEFALHAIRNPEAAQRLNQAQQSLCAHLAALLQAGLALAGRQLTIAPQDAADALMAVYDHAVQQMLLSDPDAESAVPELARRSMPQMIRAFSEPIAADG